MSTVHKYPTTPMCDGAFLELFEPTVRDSDVFVSTTAKCGQTWLQTLLFHLKTGGNEPEMYGQSLMELSPWLELPGGSLGIDYPVDHQQRLARFEALGNPRVFKMHVVWEEIPRPASSRARIITITRDPRDVPYSMFTHLHGLKRSPLDDLSAEFPSYFESWFERGFYFDFMKSFWPHRSDADVLFLRYEDLHRDVRGQSEKLVAFLGWPADGAAIDRAVPLVDFRRMQSREAARNESRDSNWKDGANFFREGAVGKNRAHLTPENEHRILERLEREVGADCLAFVLSDPS